MSGPHHWSEMAANNGASDPNADLRPGRPANTILGAIRGLMETVALARDDDLAGLIATLGANNVYSVSTNEGLIDIATGINGIPAAITRPFTIAVTFSAAPTGVAATPPHLVVDGFDCGPILHADGGALADGDLTTGRIYHVLGDFAASTGSKVTRVRCLEISQNEISSLAKSLINSIVPGLISTAFSAAVQKIGDTMTGNLAIQSADPSVRLQPAAGSGALDLRVRAIPGRFQVCDGPETYELFSAGTDGSFSTKQFGDLATWLSNNKVQKSGDRMSGDLKIEKPNPKILLYHDGVLAGAWLIGTDARMHFRNSDSGADYFSIGTDGSVSTAQFGDLNGRIEARGQAWAQWGVNQCTTSMRLAYAGDLGNDWNNGANNYAEPYGGAYMSTRISYYQPQTNNYVSSGFRWRYVQYYIPNQG